MGASRGILQYFKEIDEELRRCYKTADEARKKGFDPEERVDIPLAKNMAERVEGLISAVAPQIAGSGLAKRIQQLEQKHGALNWQVALIIAEEVANEHFCKFKTKKEAMETGIRTGFAYHTVGVVAAPLEGFIDLKIKKRLDGKEYVCPTFAGPVRGAGGTAAAFCLVITDYVRKRAGYSSYDATEQEVNRYITELYDYHERVTNLQYKPAPEEITFLIKHLPVEVDGDPTERIEVSNYKDLTRVETNRIRGGVCLVVSMLALKAPKLWKELSKLSKEFELEWGFLKEFIELQKKKKALDKKTESKISPDFTYISDLVAGRPVLTYPLRAGGFRLRYGRTRMSGYSAASINPATMVLLDRYVATGTQLKVERPGKAAALTPCDSIDGPVVKLRNGSVMRLASENEAKVVAPDVEEILFLGDFLVGYGDFLDRAQVLVPAGYCEEWYAQELEKAAVNMFGSLDLDKLSDLLSINKEHLAAFLSSPLTIVPTAETAINISKRLMIPLHPHHTYHWRSISINQLKELVSWLKEGSIKRQDNKVTKLILPMHAAKRSLELLGVPHTTSSNEFVIIEGDDAAALYAQLNLQEPERTMNKLTGDDALEAVQSVSQVKIRDKSGTFIGARMGRPEKAKMRKMTGAPQVLFPVGDEGGRLRCFQSAMETGKVTANLPMYKCWKCNKETIFAVCETCNKKTRKLYYCNLCGKIDKPRCKHGLAATFKNQQINIKYYFEKALRKLKTKTYPDLIKGVRGTSNKDHLPEHIIKGILRAANDIYVNKDGTTRYDMTELPITHFKPKEVGVPLNTLKALGYEKDCRGKPIESAEQLLELKPQDLILPASTESTDESADAVLFRVSKFVDEELAKLYNLKPYYNLTNKKELFGQLVIGLAPHTSAGIVGRIIGFSKTQSLLAHPLFHAAMRRDADGDEACIILVMDALLNFSRQFLPDARGSRTMDAPLVLTSTLIPAEVDDMVHRLDITNKYPLEFYEAAQQHKMPWEVEIELLGSRLNTEKQYEGLGFTHTLSDINIGVLCSAYKTLPSMEEKLKGQMVIAEKIRAVDASDVAKLVIEKHFLKDIKGNLRKFSLQQFRCVKCNKKFRRPPLMGVCDDCNGRIIFTISEGSIVKYLEPAISLAKKYGVSPYIRQSLELTKRRVEEVFGKEKDKQEGLGRWFG
jgi:DNA polymerase II large subunit